MKNQRDIFIDKIYEYACRDKDIYFISADFGAPSLDRFRSDISNQFVHAGISEQNMIDVAAGLALSGKKVYVYAMGPFITLRCIEQIKCCLAQMNLPVTIVSVGLGLGYADAGPTHYITEDLACLRSIVNLDVYTPSDLTTVSQLAEITNKKPSLRVLRLDRNPLDIIYDVNFQIDDGFKELKKGGKIGIFSCGYVLHRIITNWDEIKDSRNVGLIDVYRNKPIELNKIKYLFERYKNIITVEEQCLSGGFGSSILEVISDLGLSNGVKRIGLDERYYFENGGRDFLLNNFGLSIENINKSIEYFSN